MTTNISANRGTRIDNPVLRLMIKLPKTAKPIPDTIDYWADTNGDIYCISQANHLKGQLIKKKPYINKNNGYAYLGLRFTSGYKTVRLHRYVALTFIDNPNGYPIVGHKDNNKTNNSIQNLYWTTISENTQKAFDDGLSKNDKGFADSQSKPVNQYSSDTHELLNTFGSIIEASKATGISKSTIARQAKDKKPVRKPTYFRYIDDDEKAIIDQNHRRS